MNSNEVTNAEALAVARQLRADAIKFVEDVREKYKDNQFDIAATHMLAIATGHSMALDLKAPPTESLHEAVYMKLLKEVERTIHNSAGRTFGIVKEDA